MKRTHYLIIIILTVFLSGCSKDKETDDDAEILVNPYISDSTGAIKIYPLVDIFGHGWNPDPLISVHLSYAKEPNDSLVAYTLLGSNEFVIFEHLKPGRYKYNGFTSFGSSCYWAGKSIIVEENRFYQDTLYLVYVGTY